MPLYPYVNQSLTQQALGRGCDLGRGSPFQLRQFQKGLKAKDSLQIVLPTAGGVSILFLKQGVGG